MLQMVSFDIALNHYGPKAVQMLLIASLRVILDYFGPRAAQMLEVISSGAILDQFGYPKKSTYFKLSALVSFWFQYSRSNPSKSIRIRQNPTRSADIRFGVFAAVGTHGTAFHSEEPSIRNGLSIRTGFGITCHSE